MDEFDTVTLPAGPAPSDELDTLESATYCEPRIVDGACTVCDVAVEGGCCDCGPVDRDVDPDRFGDADVPDLLSEID
jgi:hypothetical protein